MKNTINQPTAELLLSQETVNEIKEMQELDFDGLNAYARAVDKVFYQYMMICVKDPNAIGIDSNDVFCLTRVKKLLAVLDKDIKQSETIA